MLTDDLAELITLALGGGNLARATQVLVAVPLQLEQVVEAVLEAQEVNLFAVARPGFESLDVEILELGLGQLLLVVHLRLVSRRILQNFEVVQQLQEFGHVHEFLFLADPVERRLGPHHHLLRAVEGVDILEHLHALLGELAFESDLTGIGEERHRSTESGRHFAIKLRSGRRSIFEQLLLSTHSPYLSRRGSSHLKRRVSHDFSLAVRAHVVYDVSAGMHSGSRSLWLEARMHDRVAALFRWIEQVGVGISVLHVNDRIYHGRVPSVGPSLFRIVPHVLVRSILLLF